MTHPPNPTRWHRTTMALLVAYPLVALLVACNTAQTVDVNTTVDRGTVLLDLTTTTAETPYTITQ